jgi:hypothetical protein
MESTDFLLHFHSPTHPPQYSCDVDDAQHQHQHHHMQESPRTYQFAAPSCSLLLGNLSAKTTSLPKTTQRLRNKRQLNGTSTKQPLLDTLIQLITSMDNGNLNDFGGFVLLPSSPAEQMPLTTYD